MWSFAKLGGWGGSEGFLAKDQIFSGFFFVHPSLKGKHFAGFDFDQSNKDIQEEENMLFFQTHPRNTLLKSIVLIKCSV